METTNPFCGFGMHARRTSQKVFSHLDKQHGDSSISRLDRIYQDSAQIQFSEHYPINARHIRSSDCRISAVVRTEPSSLDATMALTGCCSANPGDADGGCPDEATAQGSGTAFATNINTTPGIKATCAFVMVATYFRP